MAKNKVKQETYGSGHNDYDNDDNVSPQNQETFGPENDKQGYEKTAAADNTMDRVDGNVSNVSNKEEENVMDINEVNMIADLMQRVQELEALYEKAKADNKKLQSSSRATGEYGRKSMIVALLQKEGRMSISSMAERLDTSPRNISSVLQLLKKNGYVIYTDERGRKFIASEPDTSSIPALNAVDVEM